MSSRVAGVLEIWEQEQERKWRERTRLAWTSLERLHREVCRAEPQLSQADVDLTYHWSEEQDRTKYNSARMAELAAAIMYRDLYGNAEDLSILQVRAPTDDRWLIADVAVNDRLLDVKNTRRRPVGTGFSDCRVKCFKASTLTGFLSPAEPGTGSILWLGEATFDDIESLQKQFHSDYLRVDFQRVQQGNATNENGSLLPPWIFDYPAQPCYAARDKAVAYLREVKPAARLDCPPPIAVFTGQVDQLSEATRIEVAALRAAVDRNGGRISRPLLFLHVLERFCCAMRRNTSFESSAIRATLYADGPLLAGLDLDRTKPLGVYDPCRTVHELLEVLTEVDRTCRHKAQTFTTFYLKGVGILQGRLRGDPPSRRPRTIYAYCGECGTRPLYLGRTELCEACERLVCVECGHCTRECGQCQPRMAYVRMSKG